MDVLQRIRTGKGIASFCSEPEREELTQVVELEASKVLKIFEAMVRQGLPSERYLDARAFLCLW